MKKLCAKQNRRAKQWAKIENSQTLRNVFAILANFAMDCEFGKVANLAMWFANLAMWFAKLAMRNFAKLLKFYVRSKVRKCTVNVVSEFRNAN